VTDTKPAGAQTDTSQSQPFEALAAAVDDARRAVQSLDADGAEAGLALQNAIEAFHRPALVHIVRTLRDDPRGKELLFELVDDPSVHAVLGLHHIIRPDPMTRARTALNTVRPYLQSHGGDVELVAIEDDTAVVRLQGSCNGCSMSAVTLREGVEQALVDGVDEITAIRVVEDQPTAAFIPLESVGRKHQPDSGWTPGPSVADLEPGSMTRFDVSSGEGQVEVEVESFVVTNVDNKISVFRNQCVHQGLSLDGGLMTDGVLTCPWHGFTFDATTGECISSPGAQLQPIPARVDDGQVWIRAGHG
jgi:Fe-S cluster biogenesis protein NfuA/nitrite reductase/ring-hydroxylating ferredoxin subunit